jgi:hypothetical protein
LEGVGGPAVGEGRDDCDGVCYGRVVVDLRDGVALKGFEPKVHIATDVLATDEKTVLFSISETPDGVWTYV